MTGRRPLLLALGLLVGGAPLEAQIQVTATPPTALLGAWAMATPADSSGNNRTATFLNTVTAPGKYGQAQRFNGTSARMTIPTFNVGGAFTLEAWVVVTQVTRSVVGAPREGPAWWQAIIYKGKDDFYLAESGGFFTAGLTPKTGPMVQIVSPTTYPANVPHHVAASRPASGEIFGTSQPVEVGGSAIDAGYLSGVIDDVRIYGRALTAAEIGVDLATPVDTVREDVVSWDLEVFAPNTAPETGGQPIAVGTFPKAGAACNLTPSPPPPATVQNPKFARVSDPTVSGRECELVVEAFLLGLPVGAGYTTTARAKGMTTVSERSGVSNAFDRVAIVHPPLPPAGAPRVLP
jgi:hypothetical protein